MGSSLTGITLCDSVSGGDLLSLLVNKSSFSVANPNLSFKSYHKLLSCLYPMLDLGTSGGKPFATVIPAGIAAANVHV